MDPSNSGFIGREVAGRYRIQAKLGEGGMGWVYRAEQISLKRIVALKVLRPELFAEPGMVRRFNAEAELAAKLSHPNTVTLFDFGQDTDGSLFIAMEYLEGRSLREVLMREGPLAPGRALAICEQLCASLADAHSHGIVHRDLKPDNVMLAQRGRQSDVVRVLDFGIAKLRDEQGDVTARPMTRAGDLLGTPQYMAPEQIRGETVDARTDVYALGAMLYEMVTGRLPFEAASLMAILSKHLTEMPVSPRERRPDLRISPTLSQLIMDALDKDPARRPPTMDAFADRLARLVLEVGPRPMTPASGVAGGYPPADALPASPPPGVPLLRTPVPGQMAPVRTQARAESQPIAVYSPPPGSGPHPGPYPGSGPQPGPYSPAPFSPSGELSPPPGPPPAGSYSPPPGSYSPPPGSYPHQGGFASPTPGRESTAPPPFGRAASVPQPVGIPPTGPARAARGGLWWIPVGLVVAAAAGLGVFFGFRDGGESPVVTPPAVIPPSVAHPGQADPGVVASDFSVTPERELYGQPAQPSHTQEPAGYDQPGVGVWEGGWWKDSTGGLQLDIPKGFSIGGGGHAGAAMFAGHCGGAPCTIQTVTSSTYGMRLDDTMIGQVVAQLPVASGQVGKVSTLRVQGRNRYTVEVDNAGMRGQLVVFHGSGSLSIIIVQAPSAAFAQTAEFRRNFFEKRVRVK